MKRVRQDSNVNEFERMIGELISNIEDPAQINYLEQMKTTLAEIEIASKQVILAGLNEITTIELFTQNYLKYDHISFTI